MSKRLSIQALRRIAIRRRSLAPTPTLAPEPDPESEPEPEPEQRHEPQRFVAALYALGIEEYLLDSSGADAQSRSRYIGAVKTTVSRLSTFVHIIGPETAPTRDAVLSFILSVEPKNIVTYVKWSNDVLKRAPSTVSYTYSRLLLFFIV